MLEPTPKVSRRDQILQSLAEMLEQTPGGRITTSGLAKHVGVSEAALYRHFPSKAKMFEGLIEFIEETIFSRISLILKEEGRAETRCRQVLNLLLTFSERNPGITRILTGDPLSGETDRLRLRVAQLFERLETQLKQLLREAELREGIAPKLEIAIAANLMLATVEGRISQFVRSDFRRLPTEGWDSQWRALSTILF
ncbi:nucleoid occlusion factor SlmA [Pseudomonadales bacterium]|jgi:TetR/AcrR family transcriptional regulator|nr:nucleoid occlusion factor SlmA [Gammaproteobacteria bacterium]MDA7771607.1 nucleoid occlusion factor SlmA [Pseudomonadales bacterium]MBT3734328.1 nucleoid occlusion factor SlmA [Gammaproteobacteria bacterium]MBT3899862.1 nucleoid occlusion factor SlmA [Gammaproteobacteria bacterium]MDC1017892.1 nucleoid occlusion factor SlmA [Pseudomonadales bacterium]|tara:strand:+ start:3215 stop:3805 length:591 start_codon:yes stop_codon:yes gene_type:complete